MKSLEAPLVERDLLDGCKFFDPDVYLADNPDVAAAGNDPWDHYVRHGMTENRRPGPYFEAKSYLLRYLDVEASGLDAMRHYLTKGAAEGRVAPHWRWAMNDRGLMLAGRTLSLDAHPRFDRCVDESVAGALRARGQAQPAAGVLCCVPYSTPGNLTLRLLDQIYGSGVECFLSVQYPAAVGGYQEDDGPWSRRPERVFRLYELVQPDGEFEFIVHLIETRRIETLLIAGASEIYPLLPRLRDRFPGLKIVDQIFNPIGHTRRLLTFADYFDKIIVENSEMVSFFRDRDVAPAKIQEIRSGTNLAHFNADAADIKRLKITFGPKVKTVVGYVGRMSPEKNPAAFVTIAKLLAADPTIGFFIAGGGVLLDEIRNLAIGALPPEQIMCVGFVEDVRSAFQAIDLLILPSLIDGRPGAIMEANAMGVPVIATRVGGIPDMIEPGVNGRMFQSGAHGDAAAIIQDIINSPGKLPEMKRSSVRLAAERFDQENMFREYRGALAPVERDTREPAHAI
ncbi:MAG TPA: glycosyltransferase [Beijerinckiaceae bacterium]|nr:glycosyltransferase [Beijerinckiaceae bacterium]